MSDLFIQAKDVRVKRGGRTVLQVPSLDIPAGQVTVLLGDNGAGKSTFLLAAAGLMDLESGEFSLFGKPFHKGRAPAPRQKRRSMAIVLQDPYLFRAKAKANILHGLKLNGVPKSEWEQRAQQAILTLGIESLSNRDAQELSGGEKKLVALARAMALRPKGLLLDEVTASLDKSARDRVLEAIKKMTEQDGMSVIMATHIHSLADRLGASTMEISDGKIRHI